MIPVIRRTCSRLRTIFRPLIRGERRRSTAGMAAALIALLLLVTWLNVRNSYINNYFMTALADGQIRQFWILILQYAGIFVVVAVIASCQRFVEERLGLRLREELTRHVMGRYLADHAYHRLMRREDIDNPDQRIAEDIKSFTANSLSFALIILNSTVNLVSFAGVLWSITPRLVLAAVLYALFGTVGSVVLGKRLVPLNFQQLKKEADFRFRLIQVRENDEAIAFQSAERWEANRLNRRFRRVLDNFKRIISVNLRLNIFVNSFNYLTQIVPVLVVAPLFFSHEVGFGAITQAMAAFAFVLNAFTVIVTQFQQITSLAAVGERVGSLMTAIEERPPTGPQIITTPETEVRFDKLTLTESQADHLLVRELSLQVAAGHKLLVSGPNAAGKLALFRAAAGLWEWGEGTIVRPSAKEVMFLPQQPFLAPGKLRDVLAEGAACEPHDETEIAAALREAGLEQLFSQDGGLTAEKNWAKTLSHTEQRLVAFARILLAKPKVVFIDSGFDGVTADWVHKLYDRLQEGPAIYVSIGNHAALREYHDLVLNLDAGGHWNLETQQLAARA